MDKIQWRKQLSRRYYPEDVFLFESGEYKGIWVVLECIPGKPREGAFKVIPSWDVKLQKFTDEEEAAYEVMNG
jgi:hypothetical protein